MTNITLEKSINEKIELNRLKNEFNDLNLFFRHYDTKNSILLHIRSILWSKEQFKRAVKILKDFRNEIEEVNIQFEELKNILSD